jgi:hypothetical protein
MSDSVAGTVFSNLSTIRTTASGRGGGNAQGTQATGHPGGRGGNRRNRNLNNNRTQNGTVIVSKHSFTGSTADMNGHVFECHEERGDRTQYQKTLDALGECTAKNMTFPNDMKPIFAEVMATPTLTMPGDLPEKYTRRQEVIWEASVKDYAKRFG